MGSARFVGFLFFSFLVLATTSCSAASSQAKYGPYRGQIVDAETNKPIAGAAVIAIWRAVVFVLVAGRHDFYDALETVTDADGRFEIPKLDVPFFKLGVQPAEIVFFAPGYLRSETLVTPLSGELFTDPTIIKIQPAKTKQERMDFQLWIVPPIPHLKMPTFLAVLNQERALLGLKPLGKQEVSK